MICDTLNRKGSSYGIMQFQITPYDEIEIVVPDPNEGEDHARSIIVVIPVTLNNFVITYPHVSYGTGEITAKLAITAKHRLSDDNLVLNFYTPTLKHFGGLVAFDNGLSINGDDLESDPPTVATPSPIVLPAMTQIPLIDGLGIEIKEPFFTENAAQLGLDITVDE